MWNSAGAPPPSARGQRSIEASCSYPPPKALRFTSEQQPKATTPDDPKKRGGQDHHRIDIAREDEVREWAKKFDSSPQQIREAVQAVGDRADDVELHLKGSRSSETSERMSESLGKSGRKPR
jgi:hypothetical protein